MSEQDVDRLDGEEPASTSNFASPSENAHRKIGAELFLRLFLDNQRRLQAYILTLLPNRADAEDLFQEVSFVLFGKFDPEHPPRDFAAWACRIAYFKILDFNKKKGRSRICFSQEFLEHVSETVIEQAETLQLEERRKALHGCIEKLNPRDRDLLTRRFMEGATTESTATQVGRSVDAVYKALARIRHLLFECITQAVARQEYC